MNTLYHNQIAIKCATTMIALGIFASGCATPDITSLRTVDRSNVQYPAKVAVTIGIQPNPITSQLYIFLPPLFISIYGDSSIVQHIHSSQAGPLNLKGHGLVNVFALNLAKALRDSGLVNFSKVEENNNYAKYYDYVLRLDFAKAYYTDGFLMLVVLPLPLPSELHLEFDWTLENTITREKLHAGRVSMLNLPAGGDKRVDLIAKACEEVLEQVKIALAQTPILTKGQADIMKTKDIVQPDSSPQEIRLPRLVP